MAGQNASIRPDLKVVADWITPGSRVLDIGCGHGTLLAHLVNEKGVDGRGIEIRRAKVNSCVAAGLSVIRGDANKDLVLYPDNSFDYVLLTHAIQTVEHPKVVLQELVRIGTRVVVSFPNFGHWRIRLSLLLHGRMPMTETLDQPWYESRNIHLCTIQDFLDMVKEMGLVIEEAVALKSDGTPSKSSVTSSSANLWGEQAVFLLHKG